MHARVKSVSLLVFSLLSTTVLFGFRSGEAQAIATLWDSHADLRQWIAFPNAGSADGLPGIEELEEDGRDFLRIRWRELSAFPRIGRPNDPNFDVNNLDELETLLDPTEHNVLSITLRHTMNLDLLVGAWFHRNWEFDENLSTQPNFNGRAIAAGSDWTEVQLRLTESPFFDAESDVVFMTFGMAAEGLTWEQIGDRYDALPSDAYLDIDRIEFLSVPDDIPQPEIIDFAPKRGYGGTIITIQGAGFAEPPTSNVVAIGPTLAKVISGGSAELVIEAPSSGTSPIGVLVPGGLTAVSNESFEYLENPAELRSIEGSGQVATVGTLLSPFRVQLLAADDTGIPDQNIVFQLVEGQGTLNDAQSLTDEEGFASVQLTLGDEPGPVSVEATLERVSEFKVLFKVTAMSP